MRGTNSGRSAARARDSDELVRSGTLLAPRRGLDGSPRARSHPKAPGLHLGARLAPRPRLGRFRRDCVDLGITPRPRDRRSRAPRLVRRLRKARGRAARGIHPRPRPGAETGRLADAHGGPGDRDHAAPRAAKAGRPVQTPVLAVFDETPEIRTIRMARPEGFEFQAGQFLTVQIQLDGRPATRCYSISSCPDARGYLEISVKRQGRVSGTLHSTVRPGSLLAIRRPAGSFVYPAGDDGPIVLVSGGVGCTPMMSMLRHAASREPARPGVLPHSAKTESGHRLPPGARPARPASSAGPDRHRADTGIHRRRALPGANRREPAAGGSSLAGRVALLRLRAGLHDLGRQGHARADGRAGGPGAERGLRGRRRGIAPLGRHRARPGPAAVPPPPPGPSSSPCAGPAGAVTLRLARSGRPPRSPATRACSRRRKAPRSRSPTCAALEPAGPAGPVCCRATSSARPT